MSIEKYTFFRAYFVLLFICEKGYRFMGLKYKIDVVQALKDKGYTTYDLRQKNILSESTLTKLRNGEGVSWKNLEKLCELLSMQPSDLIFYDNE